MGWTPERAIEIVAGTPPGGGLDRSARAIANAIGRNRLAKVAVGVVNIGGEGGRKAWAYVAARPGEAHAINISAPNLLAERLMGVTAMDPDDFTPIAILYSEYIAFVVRQDSAIRSGIDLVARFASDAATVTVALSTSLGNSNHVALAKIVRHAGGDTRAPKIRVFDTALDAVADVLAGHADVGAITAASSAVEVADGRLRAVGISSPVRLAGAYGPSPTWAEQGVDCVVGSWRGVCGPPGLGRVAIAYWQSLLSRMVRTPEWRADLERHFWADMHLDGAELRAYLRRERDETRDILDGLGLLAG
jgi:putative tricarboxylic transport membrane protein